MNVFHSDVRLPKGKWDAHPTTIHLDATKSREWSRDVVDATSGLGLVDAYWGCAKMVPQNGNLDEENDEIYQGIWGFRV